MKSRVSYSLVLIVLLALPIFVQRAYADVVVIVSARSAVTSLSAEQVARIYLGKVNTFPGDGSATPIDQPEGTAIRDEFYTRVVRKSPTQLTAYWAKMIFTGDGYPPKLLAGNAAVKHAISSSADAIGYIDRSALDSSVKVVLEP